MNHTESFDLSTAVERRLDELNDIFKTMRWLEFTHALTPQERDLTDYQMLINDLAAGARKLAQELATASQPGDIPATLAAGDFPAPIHDVLAVTPATPASEPPRDGHTRSSNRVNR
jgi:hypothetical protein